MAEGFGGPYTPGASDIGTAVIYAVVFVGLLALMAYAGPARYSADYYLEKKISWWWKVAEIGRPAADVPALTAAVTAEVPVSPIIIPQPSTAGPAPSRPVPAVTTGPAGPAGPAASDGHLAAGRRCS